MNVVFLMLSGREPLAYGIMVLGGVLRREGHDVDVVQGRSVRDVMEDPRVARADVLAFSATTGLHRLYLRWARTLRRRFPDKALVMGGSHPTFFPEVIESAPLDGVCIGEGEESFPEFLQAWRSGREVPAGWWVRESGAGPVEKGGTRAQVHDLDSLPVPAFDLFYRQPHHARLPNKVFMATRGCPHRCTYCFNRELSDRYRRTGKILRAHSPERVVDEVRRVDRRWGVRLVWFLDANFAANRRWLERFCSVYRRQVGLPFFCKMRPEKATKKVVRMLADAGCTGVGVGIESGSERLRRGVLGRNVSDAQILDGCANLKGHGIRLLSFSMVGIPGESVEDALRTLALNVACGVDYAAATILQPYPGTEISRWACEHGYFDGDFDAVSYSYFSASPLRFERPGDRDRFTMLQRLFGLAVEFPEVRTRIRRLVELPPGRFHEVLFDTRHTWAMRHTFYRGFERLPPVQAGGVDRFGRVLASLGL